MVESAPRRVDWSKMAAALAELSCVVGAGASDSAMAMPNAAAASDPSVRDIGCAVDVDKRELTTRVLSKFRSLSLRDRMDVLSSWCGGCSAPEEEDDPGILSSGAEF